jgi:FG-GAP-like repeat
MASNPTYLFVLTLLACGAHAQVGFEPQALQHFPADGLVAVQTSLADFDSDGDLDAIVAGSSGSSSVQRFYRNTGDAVFSADPSWPDVADGGRHLVADIDADGDPDVVLAGRIVRNLGGSSFQVATITAFAQPLACADFTGDAVPDLLVRGFGNVTQQLQQVGGAFVAAAVPTTNVLVRDAAAHDFDGDGDTDLLLAASPYVVPFQPSWPGQPRLWRNDGTGQFTEQYLPGATNGATTSLAVADFDGDGDQDAVMLTQVVFPLVWQLRSNDGAGNLQIAAGLPANVPLAPLAAIDLDRDGDQDLVGGASWFENNGAASFVERAHALASPLESVQASGDIDGDLDSDLVVGLGSAPRLLLNVGAARLADGSRTPWRGGALATADFDGDGDLDLLGVEAGLAGRMGRNDGTGWFTPQTFPWPNGQVAVVRTGDMDGDADVDVLALLSVTGPPQLRFFRNLGNATFVDTGLTAPGPTLPTNITDFRLLDADGDGDQDAVVVVRQGGVQLYANNGAGAFTLVPGAFPVYLGWLRTVAVGDLDGDGDQDVLTGDESYGSAPSQLRYFANNGTGVFADVTAQRLQAPLALARSVELADLDGDGDRDAFVACWGTPSYPTSVNLLLRNDGSGNLSFQPSALPSALPTGSVTLLDFDVDGNLDAVVGTYQNGVRWWRNQGTGTFTDIGGRYPPPSTVSSARFLAGDFDDDLDPDLLLGDEMLFNQRWAASVSLLARTGRPLPYVVQTTTAATAATPFFSLLSGRTPLPPFGTLATAPGTAVLLPGTGLVGGSATLVYPIPAAPGLIGLELMLQSLFTGAVLPHLSPGVHVRFVD